MKTKKSNGAQFAYELEGAAFGITDGIICALGLIFGVAVATQSTTLTIIAALTGGVANAFGNAIGFFISQSAERGVQIQRKKKGHVTHVHSKKETIMSAVFSFIATLAILFVLILPFLFTSISSAMIITSAIGILILFGLGYYIGGMTDDSRLKLAVTFVILGMAGVAVGYFIGSLFKIY